MAEMLFLTRDARTATARYCYRKLSVRLSVCRSSETQHRQSSPRGTPPKFGWVVALIRKPAISLKRDKIGPSLLLMTNRKSHTRFRLCQNQRPWMTLKGHYTLCITHYAPWRGGVKQQWGNRNVDFRAFGRYIIGTLGNEAKIII